MELLDTEVRELGCALSPEEVAERAQECAQQLQRKSEIEQSLASARAHHKAQLEDVEGRLRHAHHEYMTRRTVREVRCEVRADYQGGRRLVVREDTGEVIEDRPLSAAERQAGLFPAAPQEGMASAPPP